MIDTNLEQLIRLEDVRDRLPSSRKNKRLSKAVVFRWALHGVRGAKLESLKIGGARFTSLEAIQRFIAAQNTPAVLNLTNKGVQSVRPEQAGSILDSLGI